jgi:serine/threonine protein kinase/tetratricopeptide (TPR) repeat protein
MKIEPGKKLGPYEILAPIGAGGMGEVWKARDLRLGRIVAIKTIKEQHGERFQKEAKTIAALNHPYICQLFDIGPDYLVLEYIEGKALQSPMPEREAVRLALQITAALEAAHRKGIIHRDLKPANILVTDQGSVKLLDFGLAKLHEQDVSTSSSPTVDYPPTEAGAILGTVAYMSPEQAQGRPADARSDIFSFGLVLYEMLSGKRAFSGESPVATALAIVKDEPILLQASSPLEKIVRHCLAKHPSDRYQSVSEIRAALEQVFPEKSAVAAAETQPSIAVLPFVNMSGDKEQEYFSDGLAEEIINALTQISELKVIARTSAFAFKGKQEDITKIAEALRVNTILEGSVRKAGNRIRVTAQLINATDGSHLWSERYDRELNDVFAIQDEISQAIAQRLRVQLSGRAGTGRHTENLEAYNLYLKGRYHFEKLAPESLLRSKEYNEQAIALDPNYALAWCGLAACYQVLGSMGFMSPLDARAECRRAVRRTLELDATLAEAHSTSAALCIEERDWPGAERELLRALDLNPKSTGVLTVYSLYYLLPLRQFDKAIEVSRRALELDPISPLMHSNLGGIYLASQQLDRALEQFLQALEIDPHSGMAHMRLGQLHLEAGNYGEAMLAAETAAREMGRVPLLGLIGAIHARAGRIEEAKKVLDELEDVAQKMYIPSLSFVAVNLALGQVDAAFDWFEKGIEESTSLAAIYWAFLSNSPLQFHPRCRALGRKMNLEP